MSACFEKGIRQDIKNKDMTKGLKLAAIKLTYPGIKVIEIKDKNIHYIRAGGGIH